MCDSVKNQMPRNAAVVRRVFQLAAATGLPNPGSPGIDGIDGNIEPREPSEPSDPREPSDGNEAIEGKAGRAGREGSEGNEPIAEDVTVSSRLIVAPRS